MSIAAYASLTPREILSFPIELGEEAAELKGGQGKFPSPSFVLSQFCPSGVGGREDPNYRAVLQRLGQWVHKTVREMPFF